MPAEHLHREPQFGLRAAVDMRSLDELPEGNPVALRMKELQTLERVAERIDKIYVFGVLDRVLNRLVKLR